MSGALTRRIAPAARVQVDQRQVSRKSGLQTSLGATGAVRFSWWRCALDPSAVISITRPRDLDHILTRAPMGQCVQAGTASAQERRTRKHPLLATESRVHESNAERVPRETPNGTAERRRT